MAKKKNIRMFFSDFLYWCPRILAILIAIFISLFSLDSFSQGYGLFEALIAFAIHLMPVYLHCFPHVLEVYQQIGTNKIAEQF